MVGEKVLAYFVTLYTPSKNPKHTCSDSLDLKPPAPLYPLQDFKAIYKYCIIIIFLNALRCISPRAKNKKLKTNIVVARGPGLISYNMVNFGPLAAEIDLVV